MNAIARTTRAGRPSGQSLSEIMLILAAAAAALAVFFPTYEYLTLYRGQGIPYKFEPSAAVAPPASAAQPKAEPAKTPEAPKTEPAKTTEAPTPAATPGATPAATPAPAPAATPAPAPAP